MAVSCVSGDGALWEVRGPAQPAMGSTVVGLRLLLLQPELWHWAPGSRFWGTVGVRGDSLLGAPR